MDSTGSPGSVSTVTVTGPQTCVTAPQTVAGTLQITVTAAVQGRALHATAALQATTLHTLTLHGWALHTLTLHGCTLHGNALHALALQTGVPGG